MAEKHVLGKIGEKLAVEHLQKIGYEILEQNYRFMKAEVDIIAKRKDILIAVEVKTRSTPEFGDPHEFVKPKQIQRLVQAVNHYIRKEDLDVEVRFDIISIIKNKAGTRIEHLEDAFYYF